MLFKLIIDTANVGSPIKCSQTKLSEHYIEKVFRRIAVKNCKNMWQLFRVT